MGDSVGITIKEELLLKAQYSEEVYRYNGFCGWKLGVSAYEVPIFFEGPIIFNDLESQIIPLPILDINESEIFITEGKVDNFQKGYGLRINELREKIIENYEFVLPSEISNYLKEEKKKRKFNYDCISIR